MMLLFEKASWMLMPDGAYLMLKCDRKAAASVCDSMTPGKKYQAEIKQYRKKRSLNANSYCWELCTKISEKIPVHSKEDVYRNAIRKLGIYKDFSGLSEGDAKTLRTAWEKLGTGWVTEQVDYMPDGETVVVRCYYGSSTYNTKQMSRLIDFLVEECKELGIETMSPQELKSLMEAWNAT